MSVSERIKAAVEDWMVKHQVRYRGDGYNALLKIFLVGEAPAQAVEAAVRAAREEALEDAMVAVCGLSAKNDDEDSGIVRAHLTPVRPPPQSDVQGEKE